MFRLFTVLLEVISKALRLWHDRSVEERGREQTIKEANDEINRQVELAEHVAVTPDPDRDERLRNRFDRSRQ